MKNDFFLKLWILFKIETTNSYVRNCHICRKSFLEIMKFTNKWLMELFLQADDPNYFSCFKFMCHNHHNQLCLMILRHKSTSLGYLFISQWREIISEFSWNYFWYVYDVEKHRKKSFKHFIFTSWLNTKANLAQQFFALSHSSLKKPSRDFNFFHVFWNILIRLGKTGSWGLGGES